jgi:hypothetical protein
MVLDMVDVSNLQFLPIYPSVVPKMDVISLFRLKADDVDHEQGAILLLCESLIENKTIKKKLH